jgi:hypothetical protein
MMKILMAIKNYFARVMREEKEIMDLFCKQYA